MYPALEKDNEMDIKLIMKPIFSLFFLCGIDLNEPRRKSSLIFSVFFNTICLGIILSRILCLIGKPDWFVLITTMIKISYLLLWWIANLRKKYLLKLIEDLESLKSELDVRDYAKLLRTSKLAVTAAFLFIFIDSGLRIYNSIKRNELTFCLDYFSITLSPIIALIYEISVSYMQTSISYAIFAFYTTYCKTVAVCLQEKERSKFEAHQIYSTVLGIFRYLEETFSAIMVIIFGYISAAFLKNILDIVNDVKKGHYALVGTPSLNFVWNVLLASVIVLSAEKVQQRANDVRQSLFMMPREDFQCCSGKYMKILEDREHLKLTVWGTVAVKKSLLLSLMVWNFTFGVVAIQCQG
ncbi:hypothetical protein AVEN_103172-1 [Araneus ventricosus]|uniref:Gustatory receptor n=1 Tax=Araneus ventricosus TaxID=182803 RepID=A0A4Y2FU69_ARAVE|nr:hypothetical protein AVEN_103172-1 [Araneus ventricosus]